MEMYLGIMLLGAIAGLIFLFRKRSESSQRISELNGRISELVSESASIKDKYKDLIDVDAYKSKVKAESESLENTIIQLRADYQSKKAYFDALLKEISLYEDQLEIQSHGLYKPHFDYDTSEKYKAALTELREKEKGLIKDGLAAVCSTKWEVNGSASEGAKQTKHYIKLVLRAFNGEAEGLLADVRWNNITKMEERLQKSFEAINKLGSTHHLSITSRYLALKLDELRLTYELQDKIRQEKEEQKRIQEQIREEERAQREIDKALKETEDEEKRYSKALDQAKKEVEKAQGDALLRATEKMAELQRELDEARAKKERALSMAQQTKAGHVYVISNIGSFGENVYKIGMTRRLDPLDRIKELSDASVPFEFDVHAVIYSPNAPELENALHKKFNESRVNLVNLKKEFFQVSLGEVEKVVKENNLEIEFTKLAEARDFRQSVSIRESRSLAPLQALSTSPQIPAEI